MEEIHCHGGVNKKMSDKILFQCDYNEGAHPKVLERLVQTNMEQTPGYSEDKYCEEAREKIRKACGDDSLAVHFLVDIILPIIQPRVTRFLILTNRSF